MFIIINIINLFNIKWGSQKAFIIKGGSLFILYFYPVVCLFYMAGDIAFFGKEKNFVHFIRVLSVPPITGNRVS